MLRRPNNIMLRLNNEYYNIILSLILENVTLRVHKDYMEFICENRSSEIGIITVFRAIENQCFIVSQVSQRLQFILLKKLLALHTRQYSKGTDLLFVVARILGSSHRVDGRVVKVINLLARFALHEPVEC